MKEHWEDNIPQGNALTKRVEAAERELREAKWELARKYRETHPFLCETTWHHYGNGKEYTGLSTDARFATRAEAEAYIERARTSNPSAKMKVVESP